MIYRGKQFLPYAAGNKIYGPGGRSNPTSGPVDPTGHKERDLKYKARRAAMLRRLKAKSKGHYANPDVGRSI
jgi:hypothetical protein